MAYFTANLLNVAGKTIRGRVSVNDLMEPLRAKAEIRSRKDDEKYLRSVFRKKLGGDESGDGS